MKTTTSLPEVIGKLPARVAGTFMGNNLESHRISSLVTAAFGGPKL
ncbi:MAG: hypothetical protein IKR48_06770 [Kiritimatiellae bacterium]|nr:hypothetical protein [Kiritimatiellia bacterium]